ncbi:MAG: hypothetical protein ABR551_03170 [Gemmatimonadales bacterium]
MTEQGQNPHPGGGGGADVIGVQHGGEGGGGNTRPDADTQPAA